MSTNIYALNIYINSDTSDDAEQPPANAPFGLNLPWFRAWRWEWQIGDSELEWYSTGNHVLTLPSTVTGVNPEATSFDGVQLSIGIFDVALNNDGSGSDASLAYYQIVFNLFNVNESDAQNLFTAATGPTTEINSTITVTAEQTEAGQQYSRVTIIPSTGTPVTGYPPVKSKNFQFINPKQRAAIWQLLCTFGNITLTQPIQASAKVYLLLNTYAKHTGGDTQRCFYKDPEMVMDKSN